MKKEDLFEVIGEIDGTIPEVTKKKMPLWLKLTAAAACFTVTVAGIRIADSFNTVGTPTTVGAVRPMITMENKEEKGGVNDLNTEIDGEKIQHEPAQATTEGETSGVFIPYPDAENATKNSEIYAGCYLNENQQLVILLTKDTPENREEVCADLKISHGNVKFEEAKYSKAYLDSIHEKITEAMMERKFETIVTSGVMEMENYVEVTLTEEDVEAIAFLNSLDDTGAINIVYDAVSTTELIAAK